MTAPSGKTFNGWSVDGQDYEAGDSYIVTSNVTFTAQWTTTNSGTTDTKPSTPTGVTATAQSSNSISVSWTSVSGASGYHVYRATSSYGTYSQISSPSTTPYIDTGLSASTTYYYKVSAYNSAGESSQSSYDSATTQSSSSGTSSTPGIPRNVTATAQSSSSIQISWNAPSSGGTPTWYNIWRSTSAYGTYTEIGYVSGSTTSYTDTGLNASTTYYYKVDAENNDVRSSQSSYDSATTQSSSSGTPSTPGTPRNVTATAQSSSSIQISWNAPSSGGTPAYYNIWRSTSAYGTYTEIGYVNGSTTSYTNTGLNASTTYYYKVDAANSAGSRSSQSSYDYATTLAATWTPPSIVGTFTNTGQADDNTLSSTSSTAWYKVQFSSLTFIKIMGIDRQSDSGKTADIVVSFYDSTGSVLYSQVNVGYLGSIERYVFSGEVYYMKVEVNPSAQYTGTYRIGIIE
jgi:fibronectin type 3 domain-containing protein